MAERRMFAKAIVLSDAFLDMPLSARCLYFTLGMFADDDGFVGSPKAIMRQCGASQDDLIVLIQKRFLLAFESGVIVIKHWRINNYLREDRHKSTTYVEELETLTLDSKGAYTEQKQFGIPTANQLPTIGIPSIGKDSIDKDSLEEDIPPAPEKESKHIYGEYKHVKLTDKEYQTLCKDFGDSRTDKAITYLDEYIEMKGTKYKSHYLALRKWVFDALKEKEQKSSGKREDHLTTDIDYDELRKKVFAN